VHRAGLAAREHAIDVGDVVVATGPAREHRERERAC
jgi:hypothetical protein